MAIVTTLGRFRKNIKIRDLAHSIGMDEGGILKFANGKIKQVPLDTAEKIIQELRRRGFDAELSDLIRET